jgi:hypothetical protein
VPPNGDPIGTEWHELYPNYCVDWVLSSWFDNGDGILSICDYVDFTDPTGGNWHKFHVEWVGPTIIVEWPYNPPILDTVYLDYVGYDNPNVDPILDPTGTYWHEVYPNYCVTYYVVGWVDTDLDGYVNYCDYIIFQNMETGEFESVHVIGVKTDIILRELVIPDPLPEGINLHNIDGYRPPDGTPVNRMWHELWPTFCPLWDLTSWRDNGDGILSVCDTVDFNNVPESLYHVEWVGPTIKVMQAGTADSAYLEYMGFDNPLVAPITDPIETYWHEVWPNYCQVWVILQWLDNGNGYLDYCDWITLQNMQTGEIIEYHIEAVETDMVIVELEICDCIPGDANGDSTYNILDITYLIDYLYQNGPPPTPYPICSGDANCDCTVNILDITYLIAFLYQNGPPPCDCDTWLIRCGPPLRK